MVQEATKPRKGLFKTFKEELKSASERVKSIKEAKEHWEEAQEGVNCGFNPEDNLEKMEACLYSTIGISSEDVKDLYIKSAKHLWMGIQNGVLFYENGVDSINKGLSNIGVKLIDLRKDEVRRNPAIKELYSNFVFSCLMLGGFSTQIGSKGIHPITGCFEANLEQIVRIINKVGVPLESITPKGTYNDFLQRGYLSKARSALIGGLYGYGEKSDQDFPGCIAGMDEYLEEARKYNPKISRADIPVTDDEISSLLAGLNVL